MKESYFEEIKNRFIEAAYSTNETAKGKDTHRNRVNYGCYICWAMVLMDMGHKVNTPVYGEDGFLKIPVIEIDGNRFIDFEKK